MAGQSIESHDPALALLTIDREPLKGKKALVTGIASNDSIACGAARALVPPVTRLTKHSLRRSTWQLNLWYLNPVRR